MRWPREVLEKMAGRIFPWAPRPERHAAIDAARQEKERSRATAAGAQVVAGEITRLARENHFAAAIREQIIRGHTNGGAR